MVILTGISLLIIAEDLTEIMRRFDLGDKELEGPNLDLGDIDTGVKECKGSLVGKFKGEKIVNYVGVKNFVNTAWGYPRALRIIELGPNMFQFYIQSGEDRDRILEGGPWIMDNQMLVLRYWYDGIEDDEAAFNKAQLWVQVWNLPVHWISKEAGRKIGAVFLEVKDVIVPQVGGKEGRHLKILVSVDMSQPLLRGTTVTMNGTCKWISFKYERCPDFCYCCGVIGHCERNCKLHIQVSRGKVENQFGPWLRANIGKGSP